MRQYGTLGFEVPLPGIVGVPMDVHGCMLPLLPVRALIVGGMRPNSQVGREGHPKGGLDQHQSGCERQPYQSSHASLRESRTSSGSNELPSYAVLGWRQRWDHDAQC